MFRFPWTNEHELNLDWIIREVKKFTSLVTDRLRDYPVPSNSNPQPLGTVSPGTSTEYSRADHVHPDKIVPNPSSLNPQPLGTASPGTSNDYSRGDHVHERPTYNAGEIAYNPADIYGSGTVGKAMNDLQSDLQSEIKNINPENIAGAVVGRNLFNKYNATKGYYVDYTNGNFVTSAYYYVSDFIPVEPSTAYVGNKTTHYAWYDANKDFISGANVRLDSTSPANAKYLVHDVTVSGIDSIAIYAGGINGVARDFTPFKVSFPWLYADPDLDAFDFYKYGAYFVNMFNPAQAIDGQYVESTNGSFSTNASYFRTGYIPVESGVSYKVSHKNRYAVYDENYTYITGANLSGGSDTFTIPANGKYLVICNTPLATKSEFILAKASEYPSSYESYGIIVPWIKPFIPKSKYDGANLVCFGDSITSEGYTDTITADTGIDAINVGLSSGRYAYSDDSNAYVNAFAFHNIVDSISSGDWTIPDSINGVVGYETQYAHIQTIKGIDFNEVDFVSIAYGTNDFSSATPLDNALDPLDTTTFKGAIRYCLKVLTEAYPNLKIIGVTPCYRFWSLNGAVLYDSDTHEIDGMKLTQYVEAIKSVYSEYHLPFVDNYTNGGINQYNRLTYFGINDGLHPNADGRALLGHRIADGILANY